MTRNLPTLRAVAADPAVLTVLPLDTLDALLSECGDETVIIGAAKRAIVACIEGRYAPQITAAYAHDGKDFGSVHVLDGDFDIEVTTPKKAEWSQTVLHALRDEIVAEGDDPSEFIKSELSVEERKFTAWPDYLRRRFEPARTVKPGTRTVKISRAKREAA